MYARRFRQVHVVFLIFFLDECFPYVHYFWKAFSVTDIMNIQAHDVGFVTSIVIFLWI